MKPKITVTIVLLENGEIQVNGPLDDKLLMYGMLETAKGAVAEHHAAKRVALPSFEMPPLLRKPG